MKVDVVLLGSSNDAKLEAAFNLPQSTADEILAHLDFGIHHDISDLSR
jgi:hypothetical protein